MTAKPRIHLRAACVPFFEGMVRSLRSLDLPFGRCEGVGAFRRCCEALDTLEILVETPDPGHFIDAVRKFYGPDRVKILAPGRLELHLAAVGREPGQPMPFRIEATPTEFWGNRLFCLTGPREHIRVILDRTAASGVTISPDPQADSVAGSFCAADENEIYAAAGLPWIPPEIRDIPDALHWAGENRLPELIRREDIRGDLHLHTTWSDGLDSLEEMAEAARSRGLRYIAVTDHTQRVDVAGGMPETAILRQWEAVDRLNDDFDDLHILKGVECDILENSELDLSDAALARADWVVASMHFDLHQSRKRLTRRLIRAIEHPEVCVIGHPTGRVIGHYDGCDFDIRAIFEAAKATGTFLELNSNPRRLDLHERNCRLAKDMGIPIVISSDAHSAAALDVLRFGIDQARRGALTKTDVANTLEWEDLCRRCKKGARQA